MPAQLLLTIGGQSYEINLSNPDTRTIATQITLPTRKIQMASIEISNLYSVGSELFKDSESFMTELVDTELGSINGGIGTLPYSPLCIYSPRCKPTLTLPVYTPRVATPLPKI